MSWMGVYKVMSNRTSIEIYNLNNLLKLELSYILSFPYVLAYIL